MRRPSREDLALAAVLLLAVSERADDPDDSTAALNVSRWLSEQATR